MNNKVIDTSEFHLDPLDPQKVEGVLKDYETRHVKHKHGGLIFVGSGGGKSTFCRAQIADSQGKTDFIDADLVYRLTNAHPCKPGVLPLSPLPWWHMGLEVVIDIEKRCGIVNQAMIDHGLWAMTTSFDPDDTYLPEGLIIVMLPWEEHKNRIIEKSNGPHYDGGAKPTEAGFALVMDHRNWTERVAKEKGIQIVDSIDQAVNILRLRENE